MPIDLTTVVGQLNQVGFYSFALPFLLVFALVYGLLGKAKLFGDDSKKINSIIALCIAFFVVNYTPFATTLQDFFTNLFGSMSLVISGMLVFVLFLAVLGIEANVFNSNDKIKYLVIGALLLITYGIFTGSVGESFSISNTTITTLFVLGFIIFVVWFITEGSGSGGSSSGE